MKLYNVKDVRRFFEVVDHCEGDVMLLTKNGGELNLKSKLSQYVSLAEYFGSGTIPEIEIKATKPKEVLTLADYLISA